MNFAERIVDYIHEKGIPPPLEECTRDLFTDGIYIPDSVSVVIPKSVAKDFDSSLEHSRLTRKEDREELTGVGLLRYKIIELLQTGEDDVFKLNICLADYNFGKIMRVLDWMAERGEIIMFDEVVYLNLLAGREDSQARLSKYE